MATQISWNKVPPTTKEVSWSQMKKKRGIYKCIGTAFGSRFLVMTHGDVLYLARGPHYPKLADEKVWENDMFAATSDEVEIRLDPGAL